MRRRREGGREGARGSERTRRADGPRGRGRAHTENNAPRTRCLFFLKFFFWSPSASACPRPSSYYSYPWYARKYAGESRIRELNHHTKGAFFIRIRTRESSAWTTEARVGGPGLHAVAAEGWVETWNVDRATRTCTVGAKRGRRTGTGRHTARRSSCQSRRWWTRRSR